MTAKTKYAVTINGQTFTRSSHREYTHVWAARRLRADAEAEARRVTKYDRQNFDYAAEKLAKGDFRYTTEADLKAQLAGGWEAHCERLIAQRLAQVAASDEAGAYGWKVMGWSGSASLAAKAFSARQAAYYTGGTAVIAVGANVTL